VLASGERHPNTHEGRKGAPVEEVSIYTRARVGGSVWGLWRVLRYGSKYSCNRF
jgi:hypothetical protein